MNAYIMPQQAAQRAPAPPPIPVLPPEPGAATGAAQAARDAAQVARDAADVAREAARNVDQAVQDAVIAGQPSYGTGSEFPVNPERIIREAIPLFGITLSMVVVIFIGWPIARAFARRIDRRSELNAAKANDLAPQIRQLQESIDTIAVELERISESQRFQSKLLAERALPEGQKRI